MFARRCAPKGVRKRPLGEAGEAGGALTEGASAAPAAGAPTDQPAAAPSAAAAAAATREAAADSEDEEHARIVKKSKVASRRPTCKHFLVGRTKKETTEKTSITEALAQKSNPQLNLDDDARATAVLDVDPDKATDHRAILERNFKIGEMIEKGDLEEGIYRGMGAYRHYVKRSEGALSRAKTTGLYGPVRGANNVRLTMYIDYKPEICKDYKETGYCGYGDCCKFLHDRTDYKEGWQVDKEWEEVQRKKQERLRRHAEGEDSLSSSGSSDSEEEEEDEDGLPFACLKCREKWTLAMNPVVTRCRHYFCESCATEEYKKSSKCSQCGTDTNGILNVATKIIEKLERNKQQEEAQEGGDRQTNPQQEAGKKEDAGDVEGEEEEEDEDVEA
ncbi:hypothetical protein Efla_001227 [Eimeria flavescens]